MNLNQLGALALLISASTVAFSILTALLGMNLRQFRALVRFLPIELFESFTGKRGRNRLSARLTRFVISGWYPFRTKLLALLSFRSSGSALALSRQALYVNASIVGLAMLSLIVLMIQGDLSNRYVVTHSSSDLSIFFRITGAWAGSSGSLLFWYFLLTVFSAAAVYQSRTLQNRMPFLFLALALLQFVFVLLGLFFRDGQPFRVFPEPMRAGQGLNPLLQHWGMIIHPPILYIGYVSSAIPFAIAMAVLISGNYKNTFYPMLRRWTIFSWFFLGTGILLGSKWAYEELGWGGYWAWDPVENASLMPFLLMTAFLHTVIVTERRGMLKFWTMLLILLAYHFSMLGTWITRSGVLQGPHSFSESSIGMPLIIYIGSSFYFYLRYIILQRRRLRPDHQLDTVTSKEGSMLLNNFLMLLSVFVILVGVFSPLLAIDCTFDGVISCHKAEWKVTAYNRIMVPVGVITLFLMGASPLLAWKKSADQVYAKNLRIPLILGGIALVVTAAVYGKFFRPAGEESSWGPILVAEVFSILTAGIAVFTVSGIIQEYFRGIRSRTERFGENVVIAFIRLVGRNKRRYGGYLVHLAIVFLFIGYAGGSFKKTAKLDFHFYRMPYEKGDAVHYYSGDKGYIDGYEVEATDLFFVPAFKPNADRTNPLHLVVSYQGHFHVREKGEPAAPIIRPESMSAFDFANRPAAINEKAIKFFTGFIPGGRMKTERLFHPQIYPVTGEVMRAEDMRAQRIPTSEPDIRSSFDEDIYIQLGSIMDAQRKTNPDFAHLYEFYFFEFQKNPAAHDQLFPTSIVATLEVWVNPLVKFVWLGSVLFFLSGLILVLPFGERE
ncbi:MAG: cytochrome c biogenesis protein CcsA [Spirochaetia bacterium]|nr:cytochrome c biogenesis protein CcsA [Spirochaetia bacterium]